ncbi:uncharacterized protein LOC113513923 [Galleria mellonella]|uniref:Uncharacterized protein LOC113513923 n=1 Tax=Galleria mellonella TaxID=7137 RepID=A0A6J1WPX6_GALME|nr:uncharacterized protein LOC113513923 [Galleria mellonella]
MCLLLSNVLISCLCLLYVEAIEPTVHCRVRSNHLRQDGGLCFEIPPWQHLPVELEQHLLSLKERWGNNTLYQPMRRLQLALVNSELSRYTDTVLAPFLDTYHKNIQTSYQQMTAKILRRIKEEINAAVQKKAKIYSELTDLANKLQVPAMCAEERRLVRNLASKHVAQMYKCTEEARASIAKMGKYAEEMIGITRNHMQLILDETSKSLLLKSQVRAMQKDEVNTSLRKLSREAVFLGYELDLSLTNARRHNEQSCEKLTACSSKVRKNTEEAVTYLRDKLYQCVYA